VFSRKETGTATGRGTVGEKVGRAGERAGEKVAEVRDVTAEKLDRAGQAVREAMREVSIDEFHLQGTVAGHPFNVDLADHDGRRALNFELNLETDEGDLLRIQGRKLLPEGALAGRTSEDAHGDIGMKRPSGL
jgi:hypothetical protein